MGHPNNPPVSIIIPCYQQERFLKGSVESALDQTYSNVEVIVVNDGSTDGSHEIASGFGNRITYIQQENSGVTVTRNRGAAAAKGRFLLCLDRDDALDRHAVELHLEMMEDRDDRLTVLGSKEFFDSPEFHGRESSDRVEVQPALPPSVPRCPGASRSDNVS